MSAQKRSHAQTLDEDLLDVETASSSLRPSHHKRSRIALAAENGGSTFSDEEDYDDEGQTDRMSSVAPSDVYYESNEDEDDDINDETGIRYMRKQLRQLKDNVAQANGIIEEVYCKNFMCHSRLRIKLGPLINFICGHNGSGKSAILTALTICLGSKASSTNRGSSMKDLIKEGQDSAILSVKVKNRGDGAYRPDVYGTSIIVERHIYRNSASGLKLKSADDRVISTRKRDLDDILDYFSFQLDNPINVLNQDMARQFLSNSTPTDKYKFFIKGVLLETLDANYRIIEESIDSITAKLLTRKDDMKVLKANEQEARKRQERSKATKSIQRKLVETRRMHAWAQVEEQESILRELASDVVAANERVQDAERAAETASGVFEGRSQAYEQAKRFLTDLTQALEPLESQHAEHRELFDAGRTRLRELQGSMRQAKDESKTAQTNRMAWEKKVEAEKQNLAEADGNAHVTRLERYESLRDSEKQARDDYQNLESTLSELESKHQDALSAANAIREDVDQRRGAVEQATRTLENLKSAQDRRFTAFKPGMARFVQMVEAERRWRKKPVGPLGQYIRVIKPEWASVIEKMIGGVGEAFVVSNPDDLKLLRDLQERNKFFTPTFVVPDMFLDSTGKEPTQDVDTVLRVLDIKDNLARNLLIINAAIDQVVLIADRHAGMSFLYDGPRPPCVKAAVTFDDAKTCGLRFEFSKSGLQKHSTVQFWHGPSRFQVNREDQIRQQQQAVDAAENDYDSILQEERRLKAAVESAKQAIVRCKRQRQELRVQEQTLGNEADALNEEIDRHRPKDGRLQELQAQLQGYIDAESAQKTILEDLARQKGEVDAEQRERKDLMEAANEKLDEHRTQIDKANEKSRDAEERYHTALRQKNAAIQSVGDYKAEVVACERKRDEQEKLVNEDFVAGASKICDRIPVEPGVTCEMLDSRLARFERDLQRAQQQAGGTAEELTDAFEAAKKAYADAFTSYDQLKNFAKTAQKSLHERVSRWKKFRYYITSRARIMFTMLLSERQFRGKLLIDHNQRMLDISVEPDLTRASDAGREAKTLSGGEKSFATICLLLSIWEAMGSPIRCLDEFDVFMDSVNRGVSVDMICQTARRAVGRQFVLITPQSMQNVTMGDDVTVYKMPDPERGQQALPFTQVR